MGTARLTGVFAAIFAALAATSMALAAEQFIPKGHSYAPGEDRLPPLNSPPDELNAQADIFETEIYRRQYDLKMFDSELQRFMQHDLTRGPLTGPTY